MTDRKSSLSSSSKSFGGLDRRYFLAGSAAVAVAPMSAAAKTAKAPADVVNLYIGTYSSPKGKGIYPVTYTVASDSWRVGAPIAEIENAAFGIYATHGKRYYILNEKDDGQVGVYTHQGMGGWPQKVQTSSHGKSPCYVSISKNENTLAVANYNTGDVVFYALDAKTGAPLEPAVIRQNSGSGPNADRQAGPHAHCVKFSPDETFIYSVDLGTDQVLGYSYDAKTGTVGDTFTAFQAPAGAGPRHLIFHPNGQSAYLVTELGNTVLVLKPAGDGKLESTQMLTTLPADFTAHSQAAHIALNKAGTRVYISNRGHNSIAIFAIAADGGLSLLQISPTLGDWPRHFLMLEDQARLVVAHQNGGNLVVFKINPDGTLAPANQTLDVPQPVFIGTVA